MTSTSEFLDNLSEERLGVFRNGQVDTLEALAEAEADFLVAFNLDPDDEEIESPGKAFAHNVGTATRAVNAFVDAKLRLRRVAEQLDIETMLLGGMSEVARRLGSRRASRLSRMNDEGSDGRRLTDAERRETANRMNDTRT